MKFRFCHKTYNLKSKSSMEDKIHDKLVKQKERNKEKHTLLSLKEVPSS